MIEFENVSLSLGDFSLKNLSLKISPGDYYFILGPSGAGKTVILEAISGLHRPKSGTVRIRGEDVSGIPPEKRNVALVYQDYSLFPHMTVYENIAFGLKMKNKSREEISDMVSDIMQKLGISHLKSRYPATMSGGEQQRAALARSLIIQPDILLLDEPLSAMDPINREKFISDLRRLHKELGITIVQVTHSREEVFALADKVAVISCGKLEQVGSLNEVFKKPKNPVVGRFVGIENIFEGNVTEDCGNFGCIVDIFGVKIKSACKFKKGDLVCAYIRGIDIGAGEGSNESDEDNVISGSVENIVPHNYMYRVFLNCGIKLCILLTEREFKTKMIKTGDFVYLYFDRSAVHLTYAK